VKLKQVQEARYAAPHPAVTFVYENVKKLYPRKDRLYNRKKSINFKISVNVIEPTLSALKEEFGNPYHDWPDGGEWEWTYDWAPDETHTIKEFAFLVKKHNKNTTTLLVEKISRD